MLHHDLLVTDDNLLDAAATVLGRLGIGGTTAEAIAAEAGLNRVTLYRRGLSPQRLVGDLVVRAGERFREAMWPAMTSSGTGRDRLQAAFEALCDVAEEELEVLAALFDGPTSVFHIDLPDGAATSFEFIDPIRRLMLDGQSDGSIRQLDLDDTAELLFNQVGWSYVHMRRTHGWPADRCRRLVVDLAVAGVAA